MRTKIHVWGGLGSQLYAFALLLTFKEKYPSRRFKIVFHTGGVTERLPEIIPLISGICNWGVKAEYVNRQMGNQKSGESSKVPLAHEISRACKFYLVKFGFIKLCNEPNPRLYPWTLSIRGHYRHLSMSKSVLRRITTEINSQIQPLTKVSGATLHFRLGDLIGLKAIIAPKILESLFSGIKQSEGVGSHLDIYSDSPDVARKMLTDAGSGLNLAFPNTKIWITVINCVSSRYFVGTNSKISYWISYLRLSLDNSSIVFLPSDLESDFQNSLGDLTEYVNLNFYPATYHEAL